MLRLAPVPGQHVMHGLSPLLEPLEAKHVGMRELLCDFALVLVLAFAF